MIVTDKGEFEVTDTIQLRGGRIGHVGHVKSGVIMKGEKAKAVVNSGARKATEKNHSATHLLQKALKIVLGNHVEQKGSLVEPGRLRFDFTHFQAMTAQELERAEQIVNEQINAALDVRTDVMTLDEAKKTGAMALFDDKYGEKVRVVSMGDFSKELCGGTHVSNTAQIKLFKIVSEQGISSGVRRIEALTGDGVIEYYRTVEEELAKAASMLKAGHFDVCKKIGQLQGEVKTLMSENESLKSKMAREALGNAGDQAVEVKGVKLIAANVDNVDMAGLRELGDQLKEKIGEGVVVLASARDGKVSLMVNATEGALKKGAHAGNLIKSIAPLVGGGGGGRPNMAQAGGKNPAGIAKALEEAVKVLESQIG